MTKLVFDTTILVVSYMLCKLCFDYFSRFQDIRTTTFIYIFVTFEVPEPLAPLTLDHGTLNFGNLHISLCCLRCIRCQ